MITLLRSRASLHRERDGASESGAGKKRPGRDSSRRRSPRTSPLRRFPPGSLVEATGVTVPEREGQLRHPGRVRSPRTCARRPSPRLSVFTTDTDGPPERPPLRAPHAPNARSAAQRSEERTGRSGCRRILHRGPVFPSTRRSLARLRRCLRPSLQSSPLCSGRAPTCIFRHRRRGVCPATTASPHFAQSGYGIRRDEERSASCRWTNRTAQLSLGAASDR